MMVRVSDIYQQEQKLIHNINLNFKVVLNNTHKNFIIINYYDFSKWKIFHPAKRKKTRNEPLMKRRGETKKKAAFEQRTHTLLIIIYSYVVERRGGL